MTGIQRGVYEFIVQKVVAGEPTPTYKEMMNAFEYGSPAPIQSALEKLTNKGYVSSPKDGRSRSIRILALPTLLDLIIENSQLKALIDSPKCDMQNADLRTNQFY